MLKFKKKQNSDNFFILSAIFLLILSAIATLWLSNIENKSNRSVSRTLSPKIIGRANLTINFGNSNKRAFEGSIVENETFIDVLSQAAQAGKFSYKLNEKSDLASIGKLASGSKKYWHWYLNGKKINKQPGEMTVKSDDNILIQYE